MLLAAALGTRADRDKISLAGDWQFQVDRSHTVTATSEYDDHIQLPGSMPQRLKGDKPNLHTVWTGALYDSSYYHNPHMAKYQTEDNFKVPFFLTPDRHYVGTAWYRKEIDVPKSFKGKCLEIYLERPHITTTLFVDGREVGTQNSLSGAHCYDVTNYLKPGKKSTIALRIDNTIESVGVGHDSHSVTDQTQGNWNGVAGRMELRAKDKAHITSVRIYTDIDRMELKAIVQSEGAVGARIDALTSAKSSFCIGTVKKATGNDTITIQLSDAYELWNEFHPALYDLKIHLAKGKMTDTQIIRYGLRKIECRGKDIYINNKETQMRGTVENCDFPLTGYPPTEKEEWLRVFRKCREYGLNHMRFHSFCPPEAAFEAADEMGFYLQPEGPSWPNHGVRLGRGEIIDTYLMEETKRMVAQYGNHPSFCMMACGNEPSGAWVPWVTKFVKYWQQEDPRRIYTGASVGGSWAWQPANEYHVKAGARGLDEWRRQAPESILDFSSKIDTVSQPFISHETGQWCVFPDLKETNQYTGVNKAKNFDIFRDILTENGMGQMADKFLYASGRLQTLCYKHEMERILRTPHYAGFQLLGLNDYSGQGSAIVGPLNVFWREKGYVDANEWTEFCAPITIMAKLPRFTYSNNEVIEGEIVINNHSENALSETKILAKLGGKEIEVESNGHFRISLNEYTCAQKLELTLSVVGAHNGLNQPIKNHYNIWVYPADQDITQPEGKNIHICRDGFDEGLQKAIEEGKNVLILANKHITYGQGIQQQFLPVFWNTSWFKMKPPHTTGAYIQNEHPLFQNFPTDSYSDVQWWSLLNRQPVMLMDRFPKDFQPIIQPIDTWFLSRKLGMLFEAKIGNSKILMTSMPIDNEKDPVQRQMKNAIMSYICSDKFQPSDTLTLDIIKGLFTDETPAVNMFTNDSPDELKKGVR